MTALQLRIIIRCVMALEGSYLPEGIAIWFNRPRKQLNGLTPLEAIEDNYMIDTVVELADAVNGGMIAT